MEPAALSPPSHRDDALTVLQTLRAAGHVAYFAGGCVRDTLLGLTPKDWDVATDAPPDRVRKLFHNTQAVGAAFGVILVRAGHSIIEVATFRSDGRYVDGRRPEEVAFTDAEHDARRRDFTINGLFLDPVENRVIDYVGGQDDLRAKRLRAIGTPDERFEEDHLRLLRAVRFAARFGFEIEPQTARAIRTHAPQLKRISPERIAGELRLMLPPPARVSAWRMLGDFGLLPVIFRYLPGQTNWPPPQEQRLPIVPLLAEGLRVSFPLALATIALCYRRNDVTPPPLAAILSRSEIRKIVQACRTGLKISNEESDAVGGILDLLPLLETPPPRVAVIKRFLARSTSGDARLLLDALAKAGEYAQRIEWLKQQFAQLDQIDFAPPPLLTGDDLVAAGWSPGPRFKRVLDEVYDAQLENRIDTPEAAMRLANELPPVPSPGRPGEG